MIGDPAEKPPEDIYVTFPATSSVYGPVQPIGTARAVIAAIQTMTGHEWEPRGTFGMEL